MKRRTVVSFMGVKIKHFWNIRTFGNVDATQLRRWGALRDLSHPLGSPRCSSSREGVRMRNPCYSRQAVEDEFKLFLKQVLPYHCESPCSPLGDRVRGSCLLINRSTYLGFSMKWFKYSRCLLEQWNIIIIIIFFSMGLCSIVEEIVKIIQSLIIGL